MARYLQAEQNHWSHIKGTLRLDPPSVFLFSNTSHFLGHRLPQGTFTVCSTGANTILCCFSITTLLSTSSLRCLIHFSHVFLFIRPDFSLLRWMCATTDNGNTWIQMMKSFKDDRRVNILWGVPPPSGWFLVYLLSSPKWKRVCALRCRWGLILRGIKGPSWSTAVLFMMLLLGSFLWLPFL